MATVRCIQGTHFATLGKFDYDTSLAKIERKHMNKMIDFMTEMPCFRKWTKNSIIKFSYYLKKKQISRNQYLYRAGDKAEYIYIIKKGEIEITRKLEKDLTPKINIIVQNFGIKTFKKNILSKKLGSEVGNIPTTQNFALVGKGSMIGEEDVISTT